MLGKKKKEAMPLETCVLRVVLLEQADFTVQRSFEFVHDKSPGIPPIPTPVRGLAVWYRH